MSKENPLSLKKAVDLKDLSEENMILYDIAEENNYVLNNIMGKNTSLVRSIQKVQLTEAIIQLVRANLGISVMASWALSSITNDENLEVVPFKSNKGIRTWYIASLNKISTIENLFIDQIKSVFNQ